MLYLEAHNAKWAITSDFIYMDLEQRVNADRVLIESGRANAKQLCCELAGLYRLNPYLEVGLAGRINAVKSSLDVQTIGTVGDVRYESAFLLEFWIDPVAVARVSKTYDEKLYWIFRGDIGGFGIGSDLTWQIQAYVGYKFPKVIQSSVGYRVMSMDYETGSGRDYFRYDIRNFGPNIRIGFNL
ncbi:hypothetical protein [Galbibacter pacificus]|uniref:Outer membrane protein beta-barrel domain-containing protein n=1 Tax=Galbibacter pacificus TaxID=2996052 RepID=A0ABT6FT71_9FLAO|nr:hypothetical protein [Galbibacter pacificus]MDG3582432.1 hypothetical protein [Galbibacter pacificus]MDG3586450.1 hypothetical protein [Galbibacter pacificus]